MCIRKCGTVLHYKLYLKTPNLYNITRKDFSREKRYGGWQEQGGKAISLNQFYKTKKPKLLNQSNSYKMAIPFYPTFLKIKINKCEQAEMMELKKKISPGLIMTNLRNDELPFFKHLQLFLKAFYIHINILPKINEQLKAKHKTKQKKSQKTNGLQFQKNSKCKRWYI